MLQDIPQHTLKFYLYQKKLCYLFGELTLTRQIKAKDRCYIEIDQLIV